MLKFLLLLLMMVLTGLPSFAQDEASHEHKHGASMDSPKNQQKHMKLEDKDHMTSPEAQAVDPRLIGVDEKLGDYVAKGLVFVGENGQKVRFEALVDKPTLVLLIFYTCPLSCNVMLSNLATVLADIKLKIGEDYNALTISFDDEETVELARSRKKNYIHLLPEGFPSERWQYLIGGKDAIDELTSSVGYRYLKTGKHSFVHPNVLIVLAPDGKIIRYLYGPRFLPFDVSMALTEAAKGTPQASIRKLLSYCFEYDPEKKTYVASFMRISGFFMLILVLILFIVLIRKRKT